MGRKMSVENVVAFACKTAEKKFHHDMNGTLAQTILWQVFSFFETRVKGSGNGHENYFWKMICLETLK